MKKLRILSYNIHKGINAFGTKVIIEQLRLALRSTQADVLLLQEVVGHNLIHQKLRSGWPSEAQFEFLADSVWPHFAYGKNAISRFGNHGNAILSKFPILEFENIDISTNRFESRGLLHALIQPFAEYRPLHLFNVHLNLLHGGRAVQSAQILKRLNESVPARDPVLIAGDFNDWSQRMTKLLTQSTNLREAHYHLHGEYALSFPSFWPKLTLDRVYFHNLEIIQAATLRGEPWNNLSDHLPLFLEIELEPKNGN